MSEAVSATGDWLVERAESGRPAWGGGRRAAARAAAGRLPAGRPAAQDGRSARRPGAGGEPDSADPGELQRVGARLAAGSDCVGQSFRPGLRGRAPRAAALQPRPARSRRRPRASIRPLGGRRFERRSRWLALARLPRCARRGAHMPRARVVLAFGASEYVYQRGPDRTRGMALLGGAVGIKAIVRAAEPAGQAGVGASLARRPQRPCRPTPWRIAHAKAQPRATALCRGLAKIHQSRPGWV